MATKRKRETEQERDERIVAEFGWPFVTNNFAIYHDTGASPDRQQATAAGCRILNRIAKKRRKS